MTKTSEEIHSHLLLEKEELFALGTRDSSDFLKELKLKLLLHHSSLMVIEILEMVSSHHSQPLYSLLLLQESMRNQPLQLLEVNLNHNQNSKNLSNLKFSQLLRKNQR